MNSLDTRGTPQEDKPAQRKDKATHGGHGWMMIACCIPMLAIAIVLVATGVASPALLLTAVMCAAMMALMMRGMSHGSSGKQ